MKSVLQTPVQELLNRKRGTFLLGLGLVLLGLLAGWFYVTHPPKAWVVRWRVNRYLKQHAIPSGFKVDFPFPSKADLARATAASAAKADAPAKGLRTGKDFDTLRVEYLTQKLAAVTLEREVVESEAELRQKKPELAALASQLAAAQTSENVTNLNALRSSLNALRKRVSALEKKAAARSDWRAREAALEPVVEDLWDFQRRWARAERATGISENQDLAKAVRRLVEDLKLKTDGATSYAAIYAAIGQELWVAQRLLSSSSDDFRRTGLTWSWKRVVRPVKRPSIPGWQRASARVTSGPIST